MALRVGRSYLPYLLKKSGLSQSEFGRRIGYSDAMVSRIISGEKKFSLVKAKEAANILNCYMDDLYQWEVIPDKGKRL